MKTQVYIVEGPLSEALPEWAHEGGNGALIVFYGVARPHEDGQAITGLDYEAYEPMASKQLAELGDDVIEKHGLVGICVEHSSGFVGNGECSFRLRVASKHRKEGLAGMDEFIDRMKLDVPIWKHPVYVSED